MSLQIHLIFPWVYTEKWDYYFIYGSYVSFLRTIHSVSHMAGLTCFPNSSVQDFPFLHHLANTGTFYTFHNKYHHDFDLHYADGYVMSHMSFDYLLAICMPSFETSLFNLLFIFNWILGLCCY